MVRDGIYYSLSLTAGAALVALITGNFLLGLPLLLLGAFCAYFFRDPDRQIPAGSVAVSPADGKIVAIVKEDQSHTRISIFLNIFDVHVNRTPISGKILDVRYKKGEFLVASRDDASSQNEQNSIVVEGDDTRIVFTQIAGLIARRIVCTVKPGDFVTVGDRIGLIKFGSRVDVIFGPEWTLMVEAGMRVSAGSSILARRGSEKVILAHEALVPIEEGVLCAT